MSAKEQLLAINLLEEAMLCWTKRRGGLPCFADFGALHIRETLQRKKNVSTKRKTHSEAKNATSRRNTPPYPSIIAPKQTRTTITTSTTTTTDDAVDMKGSPCLLRTVH